MRAIYPKNITVFACVSPICVQRFYCIIELEYMRLSVVSSVLFFCGCRFFFVFWLGVWVFCLVALRRSCDPVWQRIRKTHRPPLTKWTKKVCYGGVCMLLYESVLAHTNTVLFVFVWRGIGWIGRVSEQKEMAGGNRWRIVWQCRAYNLSTRTSSASGRRQAACVTWVCVCTYVWEGVLIVCACVSSRDQKRMCGFDHILQHHK